MFPRAESVLITANPLYNSKLHTPNYKRSFPMPIKILAFDLDYTLIDSKKVIPPENIEALRYAHFLCKF